MAGKSCQRWTQDKVQVPSSFLRGGRIGIRPVCTEAARNCNLAALYDILRFEDRLSESTGGKVRDALRTEHGKGDFMEHLLALLLRGDLEDKPYRETIACAICQTLLWMASEHLEAASSCRAAPVPRAMPSLDSPPPAAPAPSSSSAEQPQCRAAPAPCSRGVAAALRNRLAPRVLAQH